MFLVRYETTNSPEIKKTAQLLRKKGFSIGQIAKEIQVSKVLVHEWVKTIKGANRYAQIGKDRWIREIQPLGAIGQKRNEKEDCSHRRRYTS